MIELPGSPPEAQKWLRGKNSTDDFKIFHPFLPCIRADESAVQNEASEDKMAGEKKR